MRPLPQLTPIATKAMRQPKSAISACARGGPRIWQIETPPSVNAMARLRSAVKASATAVVQIVDLTDRSTIAKIGPQR